MIPGVAVGMLMVEKAEAGTWKKLSNSTNTLVPPSGTAILKANSGGQLANATAGTDYAKPDTASSWTATQTFQSGLLEKKVDLGSGSSINVSSGNLFTKTISGAVTFSVAGVPASGTVSSFILDLTNGGAATVTWWSGMKWANGAAPTLTVSGRDVLGFFSHDGGTTWNGLLLAKDIK